MKTALFFLSSLLFAFACARLLLLSSRAPNTKSINNVKAVSSLLLLLPSFAAQQAAAAVEEGGKGEAKELKGRNDDDNELAAARQKSSSQLSFTGSRSWSGRFFRLLRLCASLIYIEFKWIHVLYRLYLSLYPHKTLPGTIGGHRTIYIRMRIHISPKISRQNTMKKKKKKEQRARV